MQHRPADLQVRLESLFLESPSISAAILRPLIEDTLSLIEARMPAIDTARTRNTLAMKLRQ